MLKKWLKDYSPLFVIVYLLFKMLWNLWALSDMTEPILRLGAYAAAMFYGAVMLGYIYYKWDKTEKDIQKLIKQRHHNKFR